MTGNEIFVEDDARKMKEKMLDFDHLCKTALGRWRRACESEYFKDKQERKTLDVDVGRKVSSQAETG
jgi:hypothetical protein